MSVFDFSDYRKFIIQKITENKSIRNYRTRLSEAAGCQLSYLSQCLGSHVELTPDHAAGLCAMWKFESRETRYFMALIHHSRAGTRALKQILEKEMAELRELNSKIGEKLGPKETFRTQEQILYYSSWIYGAVHIQLLVPQTRTLKEVATALRLPLPVVERVMKDLHEVGLVAPSGEHWLPQKQNVHLSNDSPWGANYHIHWRQRAIQKLHEGTGKDLHYSGIHALSQRDGEKVKHILTEMIGDSRKVIDPSKEEATFFLGCDFFSLN